MPGVEVMARDKGGRTGLMWAVNKKHEEVVEVLLAQPGVEVNWKDARGGDTALH